MNNIGLAHVQISRRRRSPQEMMRVKQERRDILAAREKFNELLTDALEQMEMSVDQLAAYLCGRFLPYGPEGIFSRQYGILNLPHARSKGRTVAESVEAVCELAQRWNELYPTQSVVIEPLRETGLLGARNLKEKSR